MWFDLVDDGLFLVDLDIALSKGSNFHYFAIPVKG